MSKLWWVCSLVFSLLFTLFFAKAEENPCGVVTHAEKGSEVIPLHGAVMSQFKEETPLECGSMIYTYKNAFWFKHVSLSTVQLSKESFFEIPASKAGEVKDRFYLYRGKMLITSVPSKKVILIDTPNGRIEFQGGLAFIEYEPDKKLTTVASFNSSFEFKNKFNLAASQKVEMGEMSKLGISDRRVVPSEPEVMSVVSVSDALSVFDLPKAQKEEMIHLVESVFESRNRAFISDVESWSDFKTDEEREPASISIEPKKTAKKIEALNPVEADFTVEMMKKHLYGGEEGVKLLKENKANRLPASAQIPDPEYDRLKGNEKKEIHEVLDGISKLSD